MVFQKTVCCFLSIIIALSCVACSMDDVKNTLFNSIDYETVVSASFDSESDVEKFEKRLETLNLEIILSERQGNTIEYTILSHYGLSDSKWELLEDNFEVSIVDSNENTMLALSDISDLNFDGVCLNIYVDAEFFDKYEEYDIILSNLKINGEVFETFPYVRESKDGKYIEYIEGKDVDKSVLQKFAIAFASEAYESNVDLTVIQSTKALI